MRLLGLTKLTTSYVHIKLQVSFRLDKIYGVSEVDSSVSLKFRLNLSWYENRLVYHNLKKDSQDNILTVTAEKMWIPPLIFANYHDRYYPEI